MKTITERELAAGAEAVLDQVAAGAVYRITRDGTEIAELRPPETPRRFVPVRELQHRWRHAPPVDAVRMRAEAGEFYRTEDRVD